MEDKPCLDTALELKAAYQRMSHEDLREIEALELAEALVGDAGDEDG
ncbi:MAG: hypothetical protein ACREOI_15400 [bacterium]